MTAGGTLTASWRRVLVFSISALLGATLTTVLTPVPSLATHDCPVGYRVLASPATNGRGVRAANPGMRVSNTAIDCARASTIAVVNSSETRAVETGWYEETVNVTSCPQTSGPPRELVVNIFDGVFTCWQNGANITGTPRDDAFRIHDDNQDGVWNYYHGNTLLKTYNMGTFVTGDPRALGERKSSHDSAYALFVTLYRMNSLQTWSVWDSTSVLDDSDPDYTGCITNSGSNLTKYEVKLGSC